MCGFIGDLYRTVGWIASELVFCECLCGFCRLVEGHLRPSGRASGTLLPEPCRLSVRDQTGETQQCRGGEAGVQLPRFPEPKGVSANG